MTPADAAADAAAATAAAAAEPDGSEARGAPSAAAAAAAAATAPPCSGLGLFCPGGGEAGEWGLFSGPAALRALADSLDPSGSAVEADLRAALLREIPERALW